MPPLTNRVDVASNLNRTGADFLKIDVIVGLTFSGIALQAKDAEKRARAQSVARHAYDTVLKFMGRVTLTKDDAQSLARNLVRLKSELVMLGEIL